MASKGYLCIHEAESLGKWPNEEVKGTLIKCSNCAIVYEKSNVCYEELSKEMEAGLY